MSSSTAGAMSLTRLLTTNPVPRCCCCSGGGRVGSFAGLLGANAAAAAASPRRPSAPSVPAPPRFRPLSATPWQHVKQMPSRPKPPPDTEIEESFLKGSGPGGQKINKTNSAVQLKHIPTGIVVKCQETRSRDQNRKIARQLLATRLDDLHNGDQSRSAIVGAHKVKKRASAAKKSARKYRKLDQEKANANTAIQTEQPSKGQEEQAINTVP